MTGRVIIARGAPVDLPGPLALRPAYATLAEIEQRFLASIAFQSPRTGATYRDGMLRFEPGTIRPRRGCRSTSSGRRSTILEGSLHDLTLNQTFPKGTYACRPPGRRDGSWVVPEGCFTF
jgi:hypothetical protein